MRFLAQKKYAVSLQFVNIFLEMTFALDKFRKNHATF